MACSSVSVDTLQYVATRFFGIAAFTLGAVSPWNGLVAGIVVILDILDLAI